MGYIPKSRVKTKVINQKGLYEEKISGKSYMGPFVELANGLKYAGTDPYNLGVEIVKVVFAGAESKIPHHPQNRKFSKLKQRKKRELLKYKRIPVSRIPPTPEDYEKFKYIRYFAKRVNSNFGYFEISKETYLDLKTQKPHYDFRMYECGKINWVLRGNTASINKHTLSLKEIKHPGLSVLFRNLNEFRSADPLPLKEEINYKLKDPTTKSNSLKEAEQFTIERLSIPKDPLKLVNPFNYTKHNISGRKDLDGNPIANNLPPAYGLPMGDPKVIAEEQKCLACVYYNPNGRKCSFWDAKVNPAYWCKSYQPYSSDIYEEKKLIQFDENIYFDPDEEPTTDSSRDVLTGYTSRGGGMSSGGGSSGGGGGGY